jgi:putative Mg2+ transporter-C (MgtC) family protein
MMQDENAIILVRLSLGLLAGALIGLERTYHGRPAGFRTHILVSTSSSLLMLLTIFHDRILPDTALETVRIDPTRMAQGIMTGIGFLGAGVIVKESLTVRGLTTAGSIWMTASIGVMIGVGFYSAALFAVVLTLGALSLFRWFEAKVPSLQYARLKVSQPKDAVIPSPELTKVINSHKISCTGTSYHLHGNVVTYEITVRTRDEDNFRRLAESLGDMDQIDFSLVRSGE